MPTDWDATIDAGGTATTLDAIDGWTEHESLLGLSGDAVPQLASASTTSIAAGDAKMRREVEITGTTGISSFGAADAGMVRKLRFTSSGCTVNHNAAILCPGGANITSEVGTTLEAWKLATGDDWIVVDVRHPSDLVTVGPALPPGFIFGLTLSNNTTDATNDIDIAPGKARDDADTVNMELASVLTKRLDANWGEGPNQGFLDTGSKANNTTYHVFEIGNGANTDALASASLSSPVMPTGLAGIYTTKRRIGSIITDGSGAIRAFQQTGDEFLLATPPLDAATTIGTSRTLQALTVPAGLAVEALIRATTNSAQSILVQPPFEADAAPSATASPLFSAYTSQTATIAVRTNTSRQVALRATASSTAIYIATRGWIDRRGRDA